MMRRLPGVILLLLSATFVHAEDGGTALTRADQVDLGVTVYNDFAVVRDVREITLPKGTLEVEYRDVAKTVDRSSVRVTARGHEEGFAVRQQTFQFDLLNRRSLLERYIGKTVKYRRNPLEGSSREMADREGVLLAIDPEIVRFGDEVEIAPEGTISLPHIPQGLKTIPTLQWKIDNRVAGRQSIETSYLADGLAWSADYLLDLDEDDRLADMSVWVSVDNHSGIDYRDARLQLVAGEMKRATPTPAPMGEMATLRMRADTVASQPLFEYHVYAMPGRVTLGNNETKQFELMSERRIPLRKSYVLTSYVANRPSGEAETQRFDVHLAFDNTFGDRPGVPLPRGRVRVFKEGAGGKQLLGEDSLADTPAGETVEVVTGKAFDLVAERTQKSFRRTGDNALEVGYEITLRNHKDRKVTMVLRERLFGDWTIVTESDPGTTADSATREYRVVLDPDAERTVSYTARIRL